MENLFQEITRRICGNLKLNEALFDVYLYLKDYLPLDGILITVYEYQKKTAKMVAGAYDGGGILFDQTIPLSDEVWEVIRKWQVESTLSTTPWFRDEANPINTAILRMLPQYIPKDFLESVQGYHTITVALKIKDAIIGNLTFISLGSTPYNESHAEIIANVNEPCAIALLNTLRLMELEQFNLELQKQARRAKGDTIIGTNHGLRKVKDLVEQVAPTSTHVLLMGETGTGKELVANEIHKLSNRSEGPMISLNCGAIPESLIDSELFGHEKGSFTGATRTKPGRFERANKGTLFLDEIGELPLPAQTKLLRVIQAGEFERVGGTYSIKSDVRLICATHRDIVKMVELKQFREDLWYRLNVFPITIPPLRDRKQDISAITDHFIQLKCQEMNITKNPGLAPGALEELMTYKWPGNVRELQNLIERALILSKGNPLSFSYLNKKSQGISSINSIDHEAFPTLDDAVAEHIKWALSKTGGKISGKNGAAALLSINANTLRSRMQKLGLFRSQNYYIIRN